MPKIKGIYNPPAQPPEEYYWKLMPIDNDPTGCVLGLVTRTGSLARNVLEIKNGQLIRYYFSANAAAELGLKMNSDGCLATIIELGEKEKDD